MRTSAGLIAMAAMFLAGCGDSGESTESAASSSAQTSALQTTPPRPTTTAIEQATTAPSSSAVVVAPTTTEPATAPPTSAPPVTASATSEAANVVEGPSGEGATADYFDDAWAEMIEVGATDRDQQCASYTDEGTRSDAILQLLISAESVTSGFEDAQRHSDYIWSDEGVRSAHDQFFAWCPITAPAGYHFETLDELCTEWLQSSKPVPDDRCT